MNETETENRYVTSTKGGYCFPKEERLHHRSLVEGLFRSGKSFYEFPFRITWRSMDNESLTKNFRNNIPEGIGMLQMMVSVPKKKRRRAVDRVQMRRRIREAYRLNCVPLREKLHQLQNVRTFQVAFVYIHDKNLSYSTIEDKVKVVIDKLVKKLEL